MLSGDPVSATAAAETAAEAVSAAAAVIP